MEAFEYDRFVTGKYFVGRTQDCTALSNLLRAGENVAIYDAPKTGKTSVIRQTLLKLQTAGVNISVAKLNLMRYRKIGDFLSAYLSSLIAIAGDSFENYENYLNRFFPYSCFVFSAEAYDMSKVPVKCIAVPTKDEIVACLRFPDVLAKELGKQICVILNEFHAILDMDEGELLLDMLEKVEASREKVYGAGACYLFCGSFLNAMKSLFEYKKILYRNVEVLPLSPIEEKDVVEHIVKGFLSSGKSIERELIHGPYTLFRGNMWYLNHMAAICGSKTIGYINSTILTEALSTIISIHRPEFQKIISDLTDYQLNFVKAVLDGVVKTSASDVIERYGFNSSANVKRLKDALMKKEIVSFNAKDEPYIIDPLFEHWLRNYYFV